MEWSSARTLQQDDAHEVHRVDGCERADHEAQEAAAAGHRDDHSRPEQLVHHVADESCVRTHMHIRNMYANETRQDTRFDTISKRSVCLCCALHCTHEFFLLQANDQSLLRYTVLDRDKTEFRYNSNLCHRTHSIRFESIEQSNAMQSATVVSCQQANIGNYLLYGAVEYE